MKISSGSQQVSTRNPIKEPNKKDRDPQKETSIEYQKENQKETPNQEGGKGILIRGQVTHDFPVEASLDNRGLAISVFRVYCFSGSDILLRQWRVNRCVALTFLRVVNNLPVKIKFRSIRNVCTCVLNTRAKFGPGFIDSFFFFLI